MGQKVALKEGCRQLVYSRTLWDPCETASTRFTTSADHPDPDHTATPEFAQVRHHIHAGVGGRRCKYAVCVHGFCSI